MPSRNLTDKLTGDHPLVKLFNSKMKFTIEKIRPYEKWVEIWSEHAKEGKYDFCCKGYMLDVVIREAGLSEYVLERGIRGIIITWLNDHPRKAELSLHAPLTFSEIRSIERANSNLESWEKDSETFLNKCAEKYAHRYHLKLMQDLQNVAPY